MKRLSKNVLRGDLVLLFDQFLAASLSYILILPLILRKELLLVAQVATLISIYTFLLGAVRILIVTNILDARLNKQSPKDFLLQSLALSGVTLLCIPSSSFLNIDLDESLLLCAFIFLALPQEVARQYLISQKKFKEALGMDLLWLTTSATIVYLLLVNNLNRLDFLILAWIIGAIVSLGLGLILLREEFSKLRVKNEYKGIGASSLVLPVLTTLHTLILNYVMFQDGQAEELGLLRSIQFFFLPSIFLTNIQQNYFVPHFSGDTTEDYAKTKRSFNLSTNFFILLSACVSFVYLICNNILNVIPGLVIVIAASVAVNALIGRITWLMLIRKKVKSLILLRIIWLLLGALSMVFLSSAISLLLFILVLLDLILYLAMRISEGNEGLARNA